MAKSRMADLPNKCHFAVPELCADDDYCLRRVKKKTVDLLLYPPLFHLVCKRCYSSTVCVSNQILTRLSTLNCDQFDYLRCEIFGRYHSLHQLTHFVNFSSFRRIVTSVRFSDSFLAFLKRFFPSFYLAFSFPCSP